MKGLALYASIVEELDIAIINAPTLTRSQVVPVYRLVATSGDLPQDLLESNPWLPQPPPDGSLPILSLTPKNSIWRAPILTDMGVNLPEITHRIPPPAEDLNQANLYKIFNLHASFEGDDIPREDVKNSSIFKSAVVTNDPNEEGLQDASPPISLSASEIPNVDISLPLAGDEAIVSPTDSDGLASGLWLLWDDSIVAMEVVSQTPQAIHAVVQKMWSIVKDTLCVDIEEIFATGIIPSKGCEFLIVLIPKVKAPETIHQFRLIRLGQSVNLKKSRILFSKNVDQASREAICSTLGYTPTDDLGKYLGIPISAQKLNKSKWQFVVDKVQGKLASWKSKFLSFASRTTLANSVLASIPNYYMQSSFLPASIHMELDRTHRNFIWATEPEQRRIHLVNWDKVTKGKKNGGLRLKSSKESNIIVMSKLNWRLHKEKDKRWSELYRKKYNISNPHMAPTHSGSPSWKAIGKATVFGPHNANFANTTVEEYFQATGEAPNLINYDLPSNMLAIIQATPISLSSTRDDGFARKTPPMLGICASASCPWCHTEDETVEHLIRMCPISSQILGSLLPGISTTQQQQLEFVEWLHFNIQCSEKSNILNIPWNVVFCFAIWGIWLHRNQLIHSTHPYPICSASKLIIERAAEYYSTVPYRGQNQRPTCMYKWIKPPLPFLKLNADGSAIDNPRKVAGGGLIRDSWGNWTLGFSRRIGWSSILLAELWAIRDGLQLAVSRNFSHLLIETDSFTAVNLLSKDPIDNHPLSSLVFDCRDLLRCIPHVKISHVMRESNMAVDILAKMGQDLSEDFVVFESIAQPVINACIADIVGVEFPRT
ncbi:hypothetical protein SLEP1_g26102 [Rubroshorea leprosula]|uniref:RNase H type-1 domain-containing protein n=1 Tax=Rubroshorea leprosula TaxID=152421 RepID=A0AAV5JRG8_9ROSI|nr:hypothetical protein SLEP1_g26102 [Rubroshorea leprosula]